MMTAILILLTVADVALVFAFIRLSRRQEAHRQLMMEMTEERALLNDLRASIRSDLSIAQSQVRAMKDQVQVLATEAELEVKNGVDAISKEVENIISQLGSKLEQPLNEIATKQHYVERLLQRIQGERKAFTRVTERANELARFFQEGVQFDEVLKDLEDKKFSDIRAMVTQGVAPQKVAQELGVSEQEVRLIAGLR